MHPHADLYFFSFFLTNKVIAITEGGVIPATLVYLGGFYKSTELATRLAWFWGIQVKYYCSVVLKVRCGGNLNCGVFFLCDFRILLVR